MTLPLCLSQTVLPETRTEIRTCVAEMLFAMQSQATGGHETCLDHKEANSRSIIQYSNTVNYCDLLHEKSNEICITPPSKAENIAGK